MSRLAVFALLLTASCLHAHSLHQSIAEAEYNEGTKKLEVSLTVFINDLELALIRHSERMMSLEKTAAAELDTALQSYLAKSFIVTDATGQEAKLHWVGRQLDPASAKSTDPTVTLFFEIPLPGDLAGSALQHSIFCDLFEDQSNLLHLRNGGKNQEMRFKRGDGAKKLVPALSTDQRVEK